MVRKQTAVKTHIFLSRGEPCSQRPTQIAGNHEADAATQPCVGVKGIGQGRSSYNGYFRVTLCSKYIIKAALTRQHISHTINTLSLYDMHYM